MPKFQLGDRVFIASEEDLDINTSLGKIISILVPSCILKVSYCNGEKVVEVNASQAQLVMPQYLCEED